MLARTDPMRLDFCLWGWTKSEVYKEKVKHKRRIGRSHYE